MSAPELKPQTPRTDAIDNRWNGNRHLRGPLVPVLLEHARTLETELALAVAGAAVLREALERMVSLYESEHDDAQPYRPDWLKAALATTAGESFLERLQEAEKDRDEAKDDAVFWKLKYEAAELERDRLASTTEAKNYEALTRQNQEVMALNRELLRTRQ